jgi:hypothetical protein
MKTIAGLPADVRIEPMTDLDASYLPVAPVLVRNPDGTPQASLLEGGDSGFLQLSTQLDAPAASIEEARVAVAKAHNVAPALIRMKPAVKAVTGVSLELAQEGTWTEVHSVQSSGAPPWTAMLAVNLTAAARAIAAGALRGRTDCLRVTYHTQIATGAKDFSADVGSWFGGAPGPEIVTPSSVGSLGRAD